MSEKEIRKVACQFCHLSCGIEAEVVDGRLVDYRGDPAHPIAAGWLCSRPARGELIEWLYHPDQLKYPLKRAGPRITKSSNPLFTAIPRRPKRRWLDN